jgi:hypothetical protein
MCGRFTKRYRFSELVLRRAVLMLVCVWSAGCAAPQQFEITAAMAQYRAAQTCCHNLAEVRFGQLSSEPGTTTTIDGHSPAYNFAGSNLSYFGAFELPSPGAAKTLLIRSRLIQDAASPNVPDVFVPSVMLLDQQKNPIHVTDGQIGMSVSEGMAPGDGTRYVETGLDVGQFPTARYFIVFTRPELFGDLLMIQVMVRGSVIAAGRTMVQAPPVTYSDPARASPMAPRGALTITVQ